MGNGGSSTGAKKSEPKLNFEQLGRRFELNAGSIRAAIASAVAEAAMREGQDKSGITQPNPKILLLHTSFDIFSVVLLLFYLHS